MKGTKKRLKSCYMSKLKVFLLALSFAYLAKTMSGAYLNSMLTQIERRFNIPASLVGVINGSFEMGDSSVTEKQLEKITRYQDLKIELQRVWHKLVKVVPVVIGILDAVPKELSKYLEEIGVDKVTISQLQKATLLGSARIIRQYSGNLLVIAFVSYLGSKIHRPRMIALGCAVMGLGCFLIAMPQFLMGRYQYENTASLVENSSSSMALCLGNQSQFSFASEQPLEECKKQAGSSMWVFVMVGNIIRGVGETPITPLGISYVEDFARAENSPFYIGCLQIATVLGPLFGLMIGSYCAQLYVDVGFIDLEEVTISLTDARWVGAWWLGVLICAAVNFIVAVPFCFLPRSLPMEGEEHSTDISAKGSKSFLPTDDTSHAKVNVREIVKDFIPYLKSLFHNPIYMLFLCITVIQFNAYIGMFTFMPKYLEQQYGISASDAIFLIAVYNLPIICAGYFFGGLMMKKFKISTYKAAHIGFWSSVIEYLLYFTAFLMACKNTSVAGLTVSYEGIDQLSYAETNLYADCNRGCDCSTKLWDPVCGDNGIAYVSACLAGCDVSNGTGKNTVLGNCSCVASPGFPFGNGSALPGQCGREDTCGTMLHYFLILSLVCCLIYSFGAMPGYMVLIRSLKPEEKSFGVGLHSLAERVLAGIPSPIYFGAMIDTTCLKWGTKSCGGEGACRMYDSDMYRLLYLGLPSVLRGISYIPCVFVLLILRKQNRNQVNESTELEAKEENGTVEQKDVLEAQNGTHLQHEEATEMTDCGNTDL